MDMKTMIAVFAVAAAATGASAAEFVWTFADNYWQCQADGADFNSDKRANSYGDKPYSIDGNVDTPAEKAPSTWRYQYLKYVGGEYLTYEYNKDGSLTQAGSGIKDLKTGLKWSAKGANHFRNYENWGNGGNDDYTRFDSDELREDFCGVNADGSTIDSRLFISWGGGGNGRDENGNVLLVNGQTEQAPGNIQNVYWGYLVDIDELLAAIEEKGKYEFKDKNGKLIGTFTVLPEPTSGLMLLLGAGMLALRRKAVRA